MLKCATIACTTKNEELKVKRFLWYQKIFYGKREAFSGKKGFLQAYDRILFLDKKKNSKKPTKYKCE